MKVGDLMAYDDLRGELADLTEHHLKNCPPYRRFVDSRFPDWSSGILSDLPFLPVKVFKGRLLQSVPEEDLYLVMESSGTTGSNKSRIALDRETAQLQSKALAKSFGLQFGTLRGPMMLLTSRMSSKNVYSASDAAVTGFGRLASSRLYAYREDGKLDHDGIVRFLETHQTDRILILGFTFRVWEFLGEVESSGLRFKNNNVSVLHGGGWKKLSDRAVSKPEFVERARTVIGSRDVRNYYGMVEQTGSVYFECSFGNLHAPSEGEAVIRHPLTLEVMPAGVMGVVQVFSSIQRSYPGHSLLTEDVGLQLDNCKCGNPNTPIQVDGRLQASEIRGCSDAGTW